MMLRDWEEIAKKVGSIKNGEEFASSDMAREAIEILLGEQNLRDAVHYYIEKKPASELMRLVLWQIHPWSAMEECYIIFKSDSDIQCKRDAIELLRVVGDRRVLAWISEFLNFDDETIQGWTMGIIDQLLFSGLVFEEDVADILAFAINHPNSNVQEKAMEIKERIKMLNETDRLIQEYKRSRLG